MVNWRRFIPADFERDKLAVHNVTFDEAVECSFSDFEVRRNKSYRDRYQLIGRTFGGRRPSPSHGNQRQPLRTDPKTARAQM